MTAPRKPRLIAGTARVDTPRKPRKAAKLKARRQVDAWQKQSRKKQPKGNQ
jgi:hypothetical protein